MMTSSSNIPSAPRNTTQALRLHLADDESSTARIAGAWWPRSRDLGREAADLVDHFPPEHGRISRLLFSRPDWDDSSTDGHGVRSIRAERGKVKVGSFPSDDTHLMILTMSSGRRLRLLVIPSDTPHDEGLARLRAASPPLADGDDTHTDGATELARWDDESPGE